MKKRQRYNLEFKQQAVALVLDGSLSVAKAAKDLDIGHSTLDKWVRESRERDRDPNKVSEAEYEELKRLRKEVMQLKLERDFLKKTSIYFAQDSE